MEHRIQFLRDAKGQPVGCVAIRVRQVTVKRTLIEYQYSVLNPLDRFDRRLARQLALGRMVEAPYTATVGASPSRHDISEAVMENIATDQGAPTRARKAAKLWLSWNC
jgi:hypothetical protein